MSRRADTYRCSECGALFFIEVAPGTVIDPPFQLGEVPDECPHCGGSLEDHGPAWLVVGEDGLEEA